VGYIFISWKPVSLVRRSGWFFWNNFKFQTCSEPSEAIQISNT